MATLGHIIATGAESLGNSRVGVDVTGHNISNSQTPGYSRQTVNLETKQPLSWGRAAIGDGSRITDVSRSHDSFIENQLRQEIQNTGYHQSRSDGLARIESLFNPELTATVRDKLTGFFNALREFSNYPEEASVRTSLVAAGTSLTDAINTTHASVVRIQGDVSAEIESKVSAVNAKTQEIARLNAGIKEFSTNGASSANDLEDRRDKVLRELSEIIEVSSYKDQNEQFCVRGPGGQLLVDGKHNIRLGFEDDHEKSSFPRIFTLDDASRPRTDITGKIKTGQLAGLVQVRDKDAGELRKELNTLASEFGMKMNEIHRQGYGLNEYERTNGRNFFEGHNPGDGEPAANIKVSTLIENDTSAISAAFTQGASGDNVIANQMVRFFYDPKFDGDRSTVSECYDRFVAKIGFDSMKAKEDHKAANIVRTQLDGQREAISGVSLDEEAANMMKYQHLFTASSRIITTADEMFKTVLDLKR